MPELPEIEVQRRNLNRRGSRQQPGRTLELNLWRDPTADLSGGYRWRTSRQLLSGSGLSALGLIYVKRMHYARSRASALWQNVKHE